MKGNPAGHRVLIRPDKVEESDEIYKKAKEAGIDLSETKEYSREQSSATTGTILQLGHSCWWAYDSSHPDWKPWAKLGAKVIYGRFSAKIVIDPETNEELWLVNDDDILYVFGETEQVGEEDE